MAVLPTPTGAAPLPELTAPGQTTRAQAVASYAAFLSATYGTAIGQSFTEWAAAHPGDTAAAALQAWANTVAADLGPGLANVISEAITDQATGTTQIAGGTIAGLDATEQTFFGGFLGFLGDLTSRSFWLRAAKIAGGFILIIVGLIQLTRTQQLAGKVPGVGKAAALL